MYKIGRAGTQAQTPVILQTRAEECGAAALAAVLGYYGRSPSLQEVCAACEIDGRNGSRASYILKAAEQYGLSARAYRLPASDLKHKSSELPAIVFWEENHFIVVEAFSDGCVWVNDPAFGRLQLSEQTFQEGYSGIALFMKPSPSFATYERPTRKDRPQERVAEMLIEGIQGSVDWREAELEKYSTDFGKLICKRPKLVVHAACEQDIIHTFQVAQTVKLPVTIRGAGCSSHGQTLSDGGILLVNVADHAQFEAISKEQIKVASRSRWHYLEQGLNRLNRAAPVLTSNRKASVGGTLSVGGYGFRSVAYGAQVDQVSRLKLITPDGRAMWCSPTENEELFRFSLAGLGQLGIIESVEMRTTAVPQGVGQYNYRFHNVDALVDALERLANWRAERPDADYLDNFFAFYHQRSGCFATYGLTLAGRASMVDGRGEITNALIPTAAEKIDTIPAFSGPVVTENYNLPIDFIIGAVGLRPLIHFLVSQWEQGPLGQYVEGFAIHAIKRPATALRLPFEAASGFPLTEVTYLIGFYPNISMNDLVGLETVKKAGNALLDKSLSLGARPYLYGWHQLDSNLKRDLYGDDYKRLGQLRAQFDPEDLFNPGIL